MCKERITTCVTLGVARELTIINAMIIGAFGVRLNLKFIG